MSHQSFWWSGSTFVTYHDQLGKPSPVRIVTSVAVKIIKEGLPLELPAGMTVEILDQMAWDTGYDAATVNIGGAHALALLEIAEQLIDRYPARLGELENIRYMISVIKTA